MIKNGNLYEKVSSEHPQTRGWIIGNFMESEDFKSENFEVKWAVHPKGDVKPGNPSDKSAKTIVILVDGKAKVEFTNKEVINLENKGDYLHYNAQQIHPISTIALEDTTLIVIRWFD